MVQGKKKKENEEKEKKKKKKEKSQLVHDLQQAAHIRFFSPIYWHESLLHLVAITSA
mgnify:CR=1 FL=1